MTEIGKLIKEYRTKKRITQSKIAKNFGYTSPQFISNIERGAAKVSITKAMAICKYLDVPMMRLKTALQKDEKEHFESEICEAYKEMGYKTKEAKEMTTHAMKLAKRMARSD